MGLRRRRRLYSLPVSPLVLFGVVLIVLCSSFVNGNSNSTQIPITPINHDLYHTRGALLEEIESLVHRHPSKLSMETFSTQNKGYHAETTVVTYCRNKKDCDDRSKLKILLSFGQHGRELITTELALRILSILSEEEFLSSAYPLNLNNTLDRLVIKVVPMENVNGRKLVEAGDLCERRNGRGVDLNRNWSVDWGKKEKDYDPPSTPFSLPPFSIFSFNRKLKNSILLFYFHGSSTSSFYSCGFQFRCCPLDLCFSLYFCRNPIKRRPIEEETRNHPCTRNRNRNRNIRAIASSNTDLSSITVTESATFDPNLDQLSMKQLADATRDFSPELIIGDGSFGMVYKATLTCGKTVAVKKLSADAFQGFREYRAEMETLGNIKHKNIVKMLGYCSTGSDRVLIYEFIEKGSLDQWLYDTSSTSDMLEWMPLNWETRIKIVKGVAEGLAYMHNLDTPIIHRDIKASNILLDANFNAYIADFGLARRIQGSHLHVSTQVAGTMGYMPPEYIDGAPMAKTNGDVYSFGVLMLEIVTGRRPNFPFKGEDGCEIRLVNWISAMVEQERYMEMVDANLSKDELKESAMVEYFRIAMMCANENCHARPPMDEVVKILDGISTSTFIS